MPTTREACRQEPSWNLWLNYTAWKILTADEIYRRRNSKETTEIIDKIRTELYDLLANPDESRSELMSKTLNYLKNFWNQIFAYRNDGEYSIDYMAAERAIRPITVQRKNSLFFGSVKGIQNSAIIIPL